MISDVQHSGNFGCPVSWLWVFPWPDSARLPIISTFVIKMSLVRSTRVLLCSLTENFRSSASPAKHLVHAALSTWNLWFTAAPYPAERKYLDCSRGLQRQSRADGSVWGNAAVPMAAAHGAGEELSRRLPSCFCGQSTHLAKPWRSPWPVTNHQSLRDL